MFDPESISTYRLFYGDSVKTLLNFKPKSVHSMYATPGVDSCGQNMCEPWQDFYGYRAQWFQLLYDTLKDDGSLFMYAGPPSFSNTGYLGEIMEGIGWIRHDETGFGTNMHWTKSDHYYENSADERHVVLEDFKSFRNNIKKSLSLPCPIQDDDRVSDGIDKICSIFTPPDGIVLEPTVGYGRFLIAANQRGRRAIGIDQNRMSITVCRRRIEMMEQKRMSECRLKYRTV